MAKSQYKFNPDDVNFNEIDNTIGSRIWRVVAYIIGILFVAFILNIAFILLFDSRKEKAERRKNEALAEQLEFLQNQKSTVDTVFEEINEKNKNIFRLIFETEPAESNLGALNSDPYNALMSMSDEEIVIKNAGKLDSLLDRMNHEQLDYDILRIKAEDKSELLVGIPSIQPIENSDLTRTASGYGYRMHPVYKIRKFHQGVDYAAPVGTPVHATANGIVEDITRTNRGSGNRIVIDHGNGLKSVYAHLHEINTRQGRNITRGDVIGTVGNSGQSIGPHLHYEILLNGEPVNPVNYFFQELSPEEYEAIITISKNSGQSFD